jgi:hypothetical protein
VNQLKSTARGLHLSESTDMRMVSDRREGVVHKVVEVSIPLFYFYLAVDLTGLVGGPRIHHYSRISLNQVINREWLVGQSKGFSKYRKNSGLLSKAK